MLRNVYIKTFFVVFSPNFYRVLYTFRWITTYAKLKLAEDILILFLKGSR